MKTGGKFRKLFRVKMRMETKTLTMMKQIIITFDLARNAYCFAFLYFNGRWDRVNERRTISLYLWNFLTSCYFSCNLNIHIICICMHLMHVPKSPVYIQLEQSQNTKEQIVWRPNETPSHVQAKNFFKCKN